MVLISFCLVFFAITNYPLVIQFSFDNPKPAYIFQRGQIMNPFSNFDFNDGNWVMYVFIGDSDKDSLPASIKNAKSLKTSDLNLLRSIQKDLKFTYTSGDMATIESQIILCRNGVQMFESGIDITSNSQGLQNTAYGWLQVTPKNDLSRYITKFKKNYSPLILIR